MPPPRLSRHLRPCHPPVTAKQVRCAPTTARARFSTGGHDTPQKKRPQGESNADAQKKPWWRSVLGGISSFGAEPALAKSQSEVHRKPRERAGPEKQDAEDHLVRQVPSNGGDRPAKAGSRKPPRRARRDRATRERDWEGASRENKSMSAFERDSNAALQQQITQLAEQVKALQQLVQANSMAQPHSSTSTPAAPVEKRPLVRRTSTRDKSHEPYVLYGPSTPIQQGESHQRERQLTTIERTTRPTSVYVGGIIQTARTTFESSVYVLGEAVSCFAKLSFPAVEPFVTSLLQAFQKIHRVAMMEDDIHISQLARRYRPPLDLLASKLRESMDSDSILPSLTTSRDPNKNVVASSTDFLFYDGPVTTTLKACENRYFDSTTKLVKADEELTKLGSPRVASIISHIRSRLDVIAEQTLLEDNTRMRQALGHFHMNRIPERAKQLSKPGLWLKFQVVEAKRRLNAIHTARMKITHRLTRISPTTPQFSYDVIREPLLPETGHAAMSNGTTKASISQVENERERLTHQIRSRSRWTKSSEYLKTDTRNLEHVTAAAGQRPGVEDDLPSDLLSDSKAPTSAVAKVSLPSKQPSRSDHISEQSLLEELFPEANSAPQPRPMEKNRDQYPKLGLPKPTRIARPQVIERPQTLKDQAIKSFRSQGEQIAALQLTNCSTGLTEADFRRIIPKGKHLEGWRRDSDFYKVIPGRDPLSLERLPFYYLLFKTSEAALAYQNNAARLHKLNSRHQTSSIFSAIPPPQGFLEDGEDINAALSSYNLLPTHHPLSLNVVMQPYSPALRALILGGGYRPIVPSIDDRGNRIWKVLLHIEGWEPSFLDIYKAISADAYQQGTLFPLRNESQSSIHRLRDMINLKMSSKPISSARPRAYGSFDHSASQEMVYEDPAIQSLMGNAETDRTPSQMNQEVMNRVYNRWVLDFDDEDTARRWAVRWHRKMFPESALADAAWKDVEEARICNTEVLW
ncbi:hypothetical protein DDE82_004041 [Stemphylium lycopersici]|nr:hypothetical protein DDE82_004041 [Stemphylium lycopersici]